MLEQSIKSFFDRWTNRCLCNHYQCGPQSPFPFHGIESFILAGSGNEPFILVGNGIALIMRSMGIDILFYWELGIDPIIYRELGIDILIFREQEIHNTLLNLWEMGIEHLI